MATNITAHPNPHIPHSTRSTHLHTPGLTIWLTGLSASGKSTLACALEHHLLVDRHIPAYRLDGDNIRLGLNSDLGFAEADRAENIRRIAEVARLFADSCAVAITAFISPYRRDRERARKVHEEALVMEEKVGSGGREGRKGLGFVEVFVDCPVEVAEKRDPKGLYKKARAGEIKGFTGLSAPYEEPEKPEIHIRTDQVSVDEGVKMIVDYLDSHGYLTVQ